MDIFENVVISPLLYSFHNRLFQKKFYVDNEIISKAIEMSFKYGSLEYDSHEEGINHKK